jgi:hypothetical protein
LVDQFFEGTVDGIEALYFRSAGEMAHDVIEIVFFDAGVPAFLRVKNDVRSFLAGPETHIRPDLNVAEALVCDFLLQLCHDLFGAAILAIYVLANEANSLHAFLLQGN